MRRHIAILEFWEADHGNGRGAFEIRVDTPDRQIRFVLLTDPQPDGVSPTGDSLRNQLTELQEALEKALGPDGAVVVGH